ncbi:MAG TPA: DUF433 domain-containing protein [Anaerolineales bacterium]|nr:DUF433 domain-containing protein [Anaerolineales bacterium]
MVKRVEDIWAAYIMVSPVAVGGKPHINGHRITVQNVAVWHKRLGMSVEDIVSSFGLRRVEVNAALGYYLAHRAEIEAAIQADEAFVAELRSRTPSKLR